MKRLLLIIVFSLFTSLCFSQVTITMEESNGVYKIPCTVNGLKMKFIFDTGASVVSLSQSMAEYMFDNDFLSKNDIIGKAQTRIADGSVVDVNVVNIRDFEVAGFHLKDVTATIKDGQNVPLLMGQSAIEKLGRVSISGNKLIIHKPKVNLTANEIAALRREIQSSYKARDWEKVTQKSAQLKDATTFNEWDYYYYVQGLNEIWFEHYYIDREICKQILDICNNWEESGINSSNKIKTVLYKTKAHCLGSIIPITEEEAIRTQYDNMALEYYRKALKVCSPEDREDILSEIADCNYLLGYYESAIETMKEALSLRYKAINSTLAKALEGKVQDQIIGLYYWRCADYCGYLGDYSQHDFYMKLSAKCGFQEAIKYCFENNLNYTKNL